MKLIRKKIEYGKCAYVLNSECFSAVAVHLFFPSIDKSSFFSLLFFIRSHSVAVYVMMMRKRQPIVFVCVCVCRKSSGNRVEYFCHSRYALCVCCYNMAVLFFTGKHEKIRKRNIYKY